MPEIKIALFTESNKKIVFCSIKILEHGKIDANDSLLVCTSHSSSGWLHKEDDTYFAFLSISLFLPCLDMGIVITLLLRSCAYIKK